MNKSEIQEALKEPFEPDDIEWRVQRSGIAANNKPWVVVIPYMTARAVQDRLDSVFGFSDWRDEYKETPKGFLCGLSVCIEGKWITKWDGSEYTKVEALKGALSGSLKRAAVKFGIGRYLYNLDEVFAVCKPCQYQSQAKGNFIKVKNKSNNSTVGSEWFTPKLESWALPNTNKAQLLDGLIKSTSIDELQAAWKLASRYASSFGDDAEILEEFTSQKDKKKLYLEKLQESERAKKETQLQEWVISVVNNELETSDSVPVLDQVYKKAKSTLITRCENFGVDSKKFIKVLAGHMNKIKERLLQQ
jgi:hypothetical protein